MADKKGIQSLSVVQKRCLKRFGGNLRREREKRGWTLEDVLEHGYPSWQHWQSIESGLKNFSFTTLMNISNTLKIKPKELLSKL